MVHWKGRRKIKKSACAEFQCTHIAWKIVSLRSTGRSRLDPLCLGSSREDNFFFGGNTLLSGARRDISCYQQSIKGGGERGGRGSVEKWLLMRGDHLKMFQSHIGRSGKFYWDTVKTHDLTLNGSKFLYTEKF